MPNINVRYTFHPVGQGLFASGEVAVGNGQPFHWVYDCGTSTSPSPVSTQIAVLSTQYNTTGRIGLLAISHFDKDHISGIKDLLNKFSVDVLLLPYIPLHERLILAFQAGLVPSLPSGTAPYDPLLDFFVNPVEYLSRNEMVKDFVFVPSSGEEQAQDNREQDSGMPSESAELALEYDKGIVSEDVHEDFNALKGSARGRSVSMLPRGASLRLKGYWEFVPYNDLHRLPRVTPGFIATVERERDILLDPTRKGGHQAALDRVKYAYDGFFGKNPFRRNIISLFIYSGPLGLTQGACKCGICCSKHGHDSPPMPYIRTLWCSCKCYGMLYTGDGYLKYKNRFANLYNFFGANRIGSIRCLQVMHHGSRHSWRPGLAAKLGPCVSIFSSDPVNGQHGHPHPDVLHDFRHYGPVHVDTMFGYSLYLSI